MMEIPEMTHPLREQWAQPGRDKIRFLHGNAVVSVETFKALKEYSATFPSGVYAGKMWRREYLKGSETRHLLLWYSDTKDKPGYCDINKVDLIIDGLNVVVDNLTGNS